MENSDSGSTLTYPVQKYFTQVLVRSMIIKTNTNFEQNSSSSTLDEDMPMGLNSICKRS